jgi:hypothetical protein
VQRKLEQREGVGRVGAEKSCLRMKSVDFEFDPRKLKGDLCLVLLTQMSWSNQRACQRILAFGVVSLGGVRFFWDIARIVQTFG